MGSARYAARPAGFEPMRYGWFWLNVYDRDRRLKPGSPYPGIDLADESCRIAGVVQENVEGEFWLRHSRVGAVLLNVYLEDSETHDPARATPFREGGPDRTHGQVVVGVRVAVDEPSVAADVEPFGFMSRMLPVCFGALEWLREKYALPPVHYADPGTWMERVARAHDQRLESQAQD